MSKKAKLNEVIIIETRRPDGSLRVQQDFSNCPSMAEQHTAHLTDLNYLIAKYKPDELAAYMAARESQRQEILDHDFSVEPSLQEASNLVYQAKKAFEELPEDLKMSFRSPLEFYKFIDHPGNQEKLVNMGLMTRKEVEKLTKDVMTTTPQKEKEDTTKSPVSTIES